MDDVNEYQIYCWRLMMRCALQDSIKGLSNVSVYGTPSPDFFIMPSVLQLLALAYLAVVVSAVVEVCQFICPESVDGQILTGEALPEACVWKGDGSHPTIFGIIDVRSSRAIMPLLVHRS